MRFRRRNVMALGDLICGNPGVQQPAEGEEPAFFVYRSSSYLTEFFQDLDTEWRHDGSTRNWWVAGRGARRSGGRARSRTRCADRPEGARLHVETDRG